MLLTYLLPKFNTAFSFLYLLAACDTINCVCDIFVFFWTAGDAPCACRMHQVSTPCCSWRALGFCYASNSDFALRCWESLESFRWLGSLGDLVSEFAWVLRPVHVALLQPALFCPCLLLLRNSNMSVTVKKHFVHVCYCFLTVTDMDKKALAEAEETVTVKKQ